MVFNYLSFKMLFHTVVMNLVVVDNTNKSFSVYSHRVPTTTCYETILRIHKFIILYHA